MDGGLVDPAFWSGGPRPGGFYQHGTSKQHAPADPRAHTQQPIVTGTSVLAIKFNGGIMMAADTLASYGSLARFRNMHRLSAVGDTTIVGGSGDMADFDAIKHMLDDMVIENEQCADGAKILPKSVHSFMTRVLYNRRTKMNPLWNTLLVGGHANGKSFLGYVDKIGVAYTDDVMATGYGSYIALPIMRAAQEANPLMSEAEARALLIRCLKVMFYRDARSLDRYQIAVSTDSGVTIDEPAELETNWDIAEFVVGYE
jgi:20S proteasome subunit beta 7